MNILLTVSDTKNSFCGLKVLITYLIFIARVLLYHVTYRGCNMTKYMKTFCQV